jgi:flagellar biosynthesis protein FlhG
MAQVGERRLGMHLDPVGHVEHDDAVWLANRRRQPLLVDNPSSKAGRCVERVARRLLALLPHRLKELDQRAPPLPAEPNHYERLLVPRGASEEEVRRAVKRQREVYAHAGLPTVSLYTHDELEREHAAFSEAEDVLLDPARRRAYDVSVFPNHEGGPAPPSPADRVVSEAQAAELREMQVAVAKELGPDTEWSGALLRRVRESRGITLEEIATRTKVPHTHLAAIEQETFSELPSLVYVRGFVAEYAKFLRLDPTQVARTYLRRARDLLEIRGG